MAIVMIIRIINNHCYYEFTTTINTSGAYLYHNNDTQLQMVPTGILKIYRPSINVAVRVMWEGLIPYQIITKVIMGNKPDMSVITTTIIKEICSMCFQPIGGRPPMVNALKMLEDMHT